MFTSSFAAAAAAAAVVAAVAGSYMAVGNLEERNACKMVQKGREKDYLTHRCALI